MKILIWNCGGAFRKKFHLCDEFQADILIISECENPANNYGAYREWAQNYLWTGGEHKGLGVFAKSLIRLEQLKWKDDGLQLFLPCVVNGDFNLLAVWTKQTESRKWSYVGQLWNYIQNHKMNLGANRTVICGDFNSNVCWDKDYRGCSHTDVVRELAEIDLHSVYHQNSKEKHGEECIPTFYLHRNVEKPYHIDYAFVSSQLYDVKNALKIGEPVAWLAHSDHMPVSFSIAK
jgi:hypothetical protein